MPIPKKHEKEEDDEDSLAAFLGRMVSDADREADAGGTSASNAAFMDSFVYRPGPYNQTPEAPIRDHDDDYEPSPPKESKMVSYDDIFKASSHSPEGGNLYEGAPETSTFSFDALKTSEPDTDEGHEVAVESTSKKKIVPDAKAKPIQVKSSQSNETVEWMEKFKKIGMKGQEQVTSVDDDGEIIQQGPPPQPFEYKFKAAPLEVEADNEYILTLSGHGELSAVEDAQNEAAQEVAGESATSFEEIIEETVHSEGEPVASELLAALAAADGDNGVPPGEGEVETMEFVTEEEGQYHEDEGTEPEDDETDSSVESGPIPELVHRVEKDDLTSAYDPEAEYDASESSEEEEENEGEDEVEEIIEEYVEDGDEEEEVIMEEEYITEDVEERMMLANVAPDLEQPEQPELDVENQTQDVFLALDAASTHERQFETVPSPAVLKREHSKKWTLNVLIVAILLLAGVVAALVVMSQRRRQNPTSSIIPIETPAPSQEPTITPAPTREPSKNPSPSPTITPLPTTSPSSSPTPFPTVTPIPTAAPPPPTPPPVTPTNLPTLVPTAPVVPPDNDTCESAIGPIQSDGSSNFGTILGATTDDVDRCGDVSGSGPGVWYTVLGTGGEMIAHTCQGTTFDSKITIFGAFCDKPVCIEANDNFCGENGQQSAVSWFSNYREEYQILVSGEPGFFDGSFDLVVDARANDECLTAIGPLSVGNPIPIMGNTLEATPNAISCNGNVNESPSVWYLVQGTGGQMTADLCDDTDFAVTIRILTGSCLGLECSAVSSIIDCSISWDSTPFQDYYILISGAAADDVGSFSMSLTTTGLLDNDECQDALGPLALNGDPVMGSTNSATPDSLAPFCQSAVTANGVWYFLEGDGSFIQASLCDSASYDTRISVYQGDCSGGDLSALVCVDGNDDFCGAQSLVTWQALPGVRYYILVHGYAQSSGNFLLSVTSL